MNEVEEVNLSIEYMIARINIEQPRPDTRLFMELGRLTYLKARLEDEGERRGQETNTTGDRDAGRPDGGLTD